MSVVLDPAALEVPESDEFAANGAKIGYAQVSTAGQLLDRQLAALTARARALVG